MMNNRVAFVLNFMVAVILIVLGLYLLGVNAPESFVTVIQQVVGLLLIVYGAGFKYIEGN